ncbi:DeoR family transcriptional regulator [Pedobacter sp. HDW13]|uniref:DeoR family transcriptional regulator n=1 Tax=Pedobacter sp. HDW13 TaxID=2714940 RepID=UPI0014088263|nr:DeoR family transcriptional regulator [Pedobacter sp. HDW13]
MLLTVREIETRMGISNQTARTDLDHLEALGLLDAMEMNKKTKFFLLSESFEDILRKLTK